MWHLQVTKNSKYTYIYKKITTKNRRELHSCFWSHFAGTQAQIFAKNICKWNLDFCVTRMANFATQTAKIAIKFIWRYVYGKDLAYQPWRNASEACTQNFIASVRTLIQYVHIEKNLFLNISHMLVTNLGIFTLYIKYVFHHDTLFKKCII